MLKTLLDFQLEGHERFLAPFLSRFRAGDVDSDGILTSAQLRSLLIDLDMAHEADRLIDLADPFESNNITFSDIIGLLSTEEVRLDPDLKMTVLQRLFQQQSSR